MKAYCEYLKKIKTKNASSTSTRIPRPDGGNNGGTLSHIL